MSQLAPPQPVLHTHTSGAAQSWFALHAGAVHTAENVKSERLSDPVL